MYGLKSDWLDESTPRYYTFEDYEGAQRLIRLGNETKADLPDLLIGLAGRARECEATLTFERGLAKTGLFERV